MALDESEMTWWEGMEMLELFAYRTVTVVHFTDQNKIFKTFYCIRCMMVCKIGFTNWNAKIAHSRGNAVHFIQDYRITFRETWFVKVINHELHTNKNMLCFVEIQLSQLKRLPNSVQKGFRVWEWCCCFWIYFSNLKACVIVFVN